MNSATLVWSSTSISFLATMSSAESEAVERNSMRSVSESSLRGASRDMSQPSRRWSMSMISRSETPSLSERSLGRGSNPSSMSFCFSFLSLKKSLRWPWVVPIFTRRQLSMMNFRMYALIQNEA